MFVVRPLNIARNYQPKKGKYPAPSHPLPDQHALLTYLYPGLRFFQYGQLGGWARKIPIHLCRGPDLPNDSTIQEFYRQLLDFLSFRSCATAAGRCWTVMSSPTTADDLIAFAWLDRDGASVLVVVNYAPQPGQGYVRLSFPNLEGQPIRLEGRIGTSGYEREGSSLLAEGLYVDLPAWGYHVFENTFILAPAAAI